MCYIFSWSSNDLFCRTVKPNLCIQVYYSLQNIPACGKFMKYAITELPSIKSVIIWGNSENYKQCSNIVTQSPFLNFPPQHPALPTSAPHDNRRPHQSVNCEISRYANGAVERLACETFNFSSTTPQPNHTNDLLMIIMPLVRLKVNSERYCYFRCLWVLKITVQAGDRQR